MSKKNSLALLFKNERYKRSNIEHMKNEQDHFEVLEE